jgi:multidrug efflux pump subunit AcrB
VTEPRSNQPPSNDQPPEEPSRKGAIAWFAQNSVAANLLMVICIVGGLLMMRDIQQEVFPEVSRNNVNVRVAYPGASPEEVEQGVLLALEEAVRGVEGIKEIRGDANEGGARLSAELLMGANRNRALNDITAAVGRISSLPDTVERPTISLSSYRRQVITVIVHGQTDTQTLKGLAEELRRQFLTKPNVSVVEVGGVPEPEISIEVSQENLRRYNLTIQQIAETIRTSSMDLPAGGIRTDRGEVLLRTTARKEWGSEFRDIIIKSHPDGSSVTLDQIANIKDGWAETGQAAYFNGEPAIQLRVFRVGDQTPVGISTTVKDHIAQMSPPRGIGYTVWNDRSEIYQDRINLLLKNAAFGLFLVLFLLGLFLEARLAFWVTLGIVISFLGALLFLPSLNVSINMISLFGFLLALGIVVDDAIVVGEAIHNARSEHDNLLDAAIAGTREVAMPVVFAVLTTIVAFVPMLFIPGTAGQMFSNIPLIVIPVLIFSLIEALAILPAHLGHGETSEGSWLYKLSAPQRRFSRWFEGAVEDYYRPLVTWVVEKRYITVAASIGLLMLTAGVIAGGHIKFNFFPKIEGDEVSVSIEMPYGTAIEDTDKAMKAVEQAAIDTLGEMGGRDEISRGVYAGLGAASSTRGSSAGTNVAQVVVSLVSSDKRDFNASEFSKRWRTSLGDIAGVDRLDFQFSIGPGGDDPIGFELRHGDREILQAAAEDAAEALEQYDGVFDIFDGFQEGKPQIDFTLRPAGRALGLTEAALARQVRNAFYGAEAQRDQRGRDEVRVYVRRPLEERRSMYYLEQLLITTPTGGEIPLGQAAYIERGRAYTEIERENGGRAVDISADVDINVAEPNNIMMDVYDTIIPNLVEKYPGLDHEKSGQQRAQAEAFDALSTGLILALMVMFGLMAMVFRSYIQPLAIMFAIPFGVVGALFGHLLMGYNLSLVSVLGIVALSGVVVNDSLVLVAAANDYRQTGKSATQAVIDAGVRRFRPILLTSLTTFFGLAPMILETSVQARFLIPMALSLGFGVLFVTVIALIIIPATYLVLEDMKVFLTGSPTTH